MPIGHALHDADPTRSVKVLGAHWMHEPHVIALNDPGAHKRQLGTFHVEIDNSCPTSHIGAIRFTVLTTCIAGFPCISV